MVNKKKNNKSEPTDLVVSKLTGDLPAGVSPEDVQKMLMEDLQATTEGVIPRLPQISILHAGALLFKMPPDETGDEKRVESFTGIIIDQHPCNAYWEQSFQETGGGKTPDCASLDGRFGIMDGGDTRECAVCPFNQFGTAKDDRGNESAGKACKNMKRLHIMMEGHDLPRRLTIPPSSIKETDTFLSTLRDQRIPMTSAKVRFKLTEATSGGGIEYSQIRFEYLGQIPVRVYLKLKDFLRLFKAQIRGQEVTGDEYKPEENGESMPF